MVTNEQTINANAYVLGITKETVIQSLYKLFYNAVVNNVVDTHSPARTKWWYPAWPDVEIDNSGSYPIGIINSPEIEWNKFTFTKKTITASVDIDIYVTKQKQLDSLSDQIWNAVENYRPTLRNIQVRFVKLEGSATDHIVRDKITVHAKTMTFTCTFNFISSITGNGTNIARQGRQLTSDSTIN